MLRSSIWNSEQYLIRVPLETGWLDLSGKILNLGIFYSNFTWMCIMIVSDRHFQIWWFRENRIRKKILGVEFEECCYWPALYFFINLWSLVCSCLNSYWTFHLFPLLTFFFKLVAFCTEFNLFTPICFVLFMIMDLPYICDHQVGYSAGGYSLSPRWFLTWYIYPFFQV